MRLLAVAAFALAFVATPLPALAQEIVLEGVANRPAELNVGGMSYEDRLRSAIGQASRNLLGACPSITARSLHFADISHSDAFTATLTDGGASFYQERMLLEGCGNSFMPNFMVLHRPDDTAIVSMVPGETLASLKLMMDAQAPAIAAAGVVARCGDMSGASFVHSVVAVQPTGADPGQRWSELWTLRVCGANVEIPVDFLRTDAGATFTFRPSAGRVVAAQPSSQNGGQ